MRPERLDFYLAGLLLTAAGLFLYDESSGGRLDRVQRVRGRDFLQFYIAGSIVRAGQADRLYDQEHFLSIQQSFVPVSQANPRYYSLYPPLVALAFSPLAALSYSKAVLLWWSLQAACFVAAGWLLLRSSAVAARWQRTVALALAVFYPVWLTFFNGQLAAMLLAVLAAGLCVLDGPLANGAPKSGRPTVDFDGESRLPKAVRGLAGGLVLSILLVKPQFGVGLGLGLALCGRGWALVGLAVGGIGQLGLVAAVLGPEVVVAYLRELPPLYARLGEIYSFTPDYEHAVSGILANVTGGPSRWHRIVHFGLAGLGAILLWRAASSPRPDLSARRVQHAALVVFMLLVTPHLLVYDLVLLAIPVMHSWSLGAARWHRLGHILYLAAMLSPAYEWTGFSLVPAALIWALFEYGRRQARFRGGVSIIAPGTIPQ